ncbi:hypothetical protein [Rhizobium sullae]|uniref:hypothetical protein n=1 Tax=Rhizobium sullae TaxID=50338 RepID=UPI0010464050|nr:hypothetical protein [Rhizobium sullae]
MPDKNTSSHWVRPQASDLWTLGKLLDYRAEIGDVAAAIRNSHPQTARHQMFNDCCGKHDRRLIRPYRSIGERKIEQILFSHNEASPTSTIALARVKGADSEAIHPHVAGFRASLPPAPIATKRYRGHSQILRLSSDLHVHLLSEPASGRRKWHA